jgi:hypothetical protein
MTLFYFNTIFLFIMFLVCSSSIFDIVMIDNEFMHEIAKRLIQYLSELSGQHYVSMVLIYCLSVDALYMPGHVVDRGCDTPVESFIVHFPYVEQVEPSCKGSLALFLIFLSNVPYAYMKSHYAIHGCICARVYKRLSK